MSETLVIRLLPTHASTSHSTPAAQWLLVDTHGARLGAVLQGSLQEAAGLASGRKVIVLVTGTEALHVEPVLPPLKGGAKLSQIVPYALEDQLASDVDALHFAVGKPEGRPGTPVIVVSHDAMQAWIFALRDAGLHADALYTDSSQLPLTEHGATLLIDAGRVSVRSADAPVTTLDVAPLADALQMLLPADADAPLTLYVTEAEYDQEQPVIDALRERMHDVQIKLLPDGVLPLLALQATQGGAHGNINLLQGVYTPRTNMRSNLQPWRYAAVLFIGLVAIHVAVKAIELRSLSKQDALLDQQIAQTYAQGMPGAPAVPAAEARRTFESRLLQMQNSNAGSGLMLSLSTLTDAVKKTPDLQLDTISYRDNSVSLQLQAPTVDALEQIRQQAQSRGVSAEIQAANPKDNRIEGRMQMKLPQGA